MIKEEYVSFEVAKLLKDKGFDQKCSKFLHVGLGLYTHTPKEVIPKGADILELPTQAMAMRWLREVHNIYIEICLYKTNEDDIEPKKSRKAPYYTFSVYNIVTGNNIDKRLTNDFIGNTYEQACEAAIKYCLENLI